MTCMEICFWSSKLVSIQNFASSRPNKGSFWKFRNIYARTVFYWCLYLQWLKKVSNITKLHIFWVLRHFLPHGVYSGWGIVVTVLVRTSVRTFVQNFFWDFWFFGILNLVVLDDFFIFWKKWFFGPAMPFFWPFFWLHFWRFLPPSMRFKMEQKSLNMLLTFGRFWNWLLIDFDLPNHALYLQLWLFRIDEMLIFKN